MATYKPRIYCAAPSHRAKMWRSDILGPDVTIVSTWHNNLNFEADDQSPVACAKYWDLDLEQIRQADILMAYAESNDRPNGTLIEIGYAIAHVTPVALVGNFDWGTWRHMPLVTHYPTLREAIDSILGVHPDDPTES
jgi:nucleoside 2-deoxyribosyltransferase